MGDVLISKLEEIIPGNNDYALIEPAATLGSYKKAKVANLPGGSGSSGALQLAAPAISLSVISSSQINVSWSNVANETGYVVERSLNGTVWTAAATLAANVTSYSATGLSSSTLYYFRVRATGDGISYSNSEWDQDSATTSSGAIPQLSTPTLTATVISSTQIDLSWTNVANEMGYQVQQSLNGTSWTTIDTPAANVTSMNVTGLSPSTLYYFRVKAVGDGIAYADSANGTDSDTTSAGGSGYETESDAYFAANTGLTTPEKDAVDAFVVSLKAIGWTKFKAVYLPIWGSASDNKWNLTNPADTDGAYRLTFAGTVTHGANFIKSDGSTGYANTHLNGSTALANENCGMSVFVKNANTGGGNRALMGSGDASLANAFAIFLDIASSTFSYAFETGGAAEFVSEAFSSPPADRWISMSRDNSPLLSQYINGGAAGTKTGALVGTMPNQNIYLLGINNNGTADRFTYDPGTGENEIQFFAIHDALDSSASNNLRTAWNTLKTALSI